MLHSAEKPLDGVFADHSEIFAQHRYEVIETRADETRGFDSVVTPRRAE